MHALPCHDEVAGKEKINVVYNNKKGGVDNPDQMCTLYTTTRKTNRWLMRVFYAMIDSSALNAYLIFTHRVPVFVGKRPDKHSKFLKELAISLIVPHAKRRFVASQTPYIVKEIICSCEILPAQTQVVQSMNSRSASVRKRCFLFVQNTRTKSTGLSIGVARIFDWGEGAKSHAITLLEISKKGTFCGAKIP